MEPLQVVDKKTQVSGSRARKQKDVGEEQTLARTDLNRQRLSFTEAAHFIPAPVFLPTRMDLCLFVLCCAVINAAL